MIEKRFESDGWTIFDNESGDTMGMIGASNLLNNLHEENIALKRTDNICDLETQIMQLREELDYYKSKCASLETGLIQVERTNFKLQEENQQYKQLIKKVLEITPIEHSLAIDLKNSIRELYE